MPMSSFPKRRLGSGHGNQIIAHAEGAARSLWNCATVVMTVISLRAELIAWYERRGYKKVGTRPFPFSREPGARRTDFHFVVLSKPSPCKSWKWCILR
jgi:hypothetical protein